ncbi:MAG: ComEA family DNA-binding protein, partial [Anaerolineae bacterium]|nr:ComEA family DNA-binding protein [Anaerolineae bacterium]
MLERYKAPIFAVLIVVLGLGIIILLTYQPTPVSITILPPAPTGTPGPLAVYVTGAVGAPGKMLTLPPESRVIDAIDAAGGFGPDADRAALNVARLLRDGEQIHVPSLNTAPPAADPASAPAQISALNVNTATAEQLQALPDVGPALAAAIIAYREAHGPFAGL